MLFERRDLTELDSLDRIFQTGLLDFTGFPKLLRQLSVQALTLHSSTPHAPDKGAQRYA
jgi:hypothetical protein